MSPRYHPWLIAAYYFFFYGAIGCLIPYLPLYYQSIGLGGEQIGLLMGLAPIVLLISGPLWGSIGDRFNLHRWLLPIASLGAVLPILLFPLARDLNWLVFIVIFQAFFGTAIGPLMDSAALEIAASSGAAFGRLRLGGSVGFTLVSVLIGWLLTHASLLWMFYSYMIFMTLAALVALPLPARRRQWKAPIRQGFSALLRQPPLIFFLLAAFLVGISMSSVQFFMPLFFKSIGADASWLGIAGAVAALSEIPIMFNAGRIHKRIGGLWPGVAIGLGFFVTRFWLLSVVTTPAQAVAVQILHGVSFGLFLVSGVAYVESLAPPGLSATAQSLYIVAFAGLGACIGSLGGGIIFEQLGSAILFQMSGLATLAALGLHVASRWLARPVITPIQ